MHPKELKVSHIHMVNLETGEDFTFEDISTISIEYDETEKIKNKEVIDKFTTNHTVTFDIRLSNGMKYMLLYSNNWLKLHGFPMRRRIKKKFQ